MRKASLLALAAAAMAGEIHGFNGGFGSPDPPKGPPMRDISKDPKIQSNRGLHLYRVGGKEVWAINERVARKKAKKLK